MRRRFYLSVSLVLTFLGITTSGPVTAQTFDAGAHFSDIPTSIAEYLRSTGQPPSSAETVKIPEPSMYIGWDIAWDTLLRGGAIEFQFAGHKLAVKSGFVRGEFDTYAQTYKAAPVLLVYDTTENLIYHYFTAGTERDCRGDALNIRVSFTGKTVVIRNNKNTAEQTTLRYPDLLEEWTKFASSYCSTYIGKRHCLVPQNLWDGAHRYGFVLTEGSPLYYTTNLPQDFVELYKKEDGNTTFKPAAYSLAARLAFILSPTQKKTWEVRQMTAEEVGEAMLERSKKYSASQDNSVSETSGVMIWKE
jgi:hypothetical protein